MGHTRWSVGYTTFTVLYSMLDPLGYWSQHRKHQFLKIMAYLGEKKDKRVLEEADLQWKSGLLWRTNKLFWLDTAVYLSFEIIRKIAVILIEVHFDVWLRCCCCLGPRGWPWARCCWLVARSPVYVIARFVDSPLLLLLFPTYVPTYCT